MVKRSRVTKVKRSRATKAKKRRERRITPMPTKITSLEDARVLKRMNAPLNTPVERRTFSEGYSRRWFALMDAHTKFLMAMREYSDGARAGSGSQWKLVRRRLASLDKAAARCVDFVVAGNVPAEGEPVFKTEQDQHEHALLRYFIVERALPFIEFWQEAIDAVDAGGITLTIRPEDIPLWTDE